MAASSAQTSPPVRKRVVPTPNAPPEALTQRFADDVARLTGDGAKDRFGIAVSGGPDSVAMLLLAHAAFPARMEAATVDHRLRPASTVEANYVAAQCAERAIPHSILTLDGLPAGNVSNEARKARYAALESWCDDRNIDWLMTAHHADDQLETMIMRLNRGSGVAGLSGIRARQGRIVRPLLHWRHDELVALLDDMGVEAVDDPTNHDDAYDRARLRKKMREIDMFDARAAAISADALADADAALEFWVDRLEAAHIRQDDGGVAFDPTHADLPIDILRRLTLRCIRLVDPDAKPRGAPLMQLIKTLQAGGRSTIGNVVATGGDSWHFAPAPPRRNAT
jgi:tRNA(Ile)-lysidine synthase